MPRRVRVHRAPAALAALLLALAATAAADPAATADRVAARAARVTGGDDGSARLSFVTEIPGRRPLRQDFAMLYRHEAGGPVETRAVFFPEFPPDRKGYAWLGLLARPGAGGEDQAWMYLPDLRAVRRVHGPDEAEEDPFHHSLLSGVELVPRPPGRDRHRLLGDDTLDGVPVDVLETTTDGTDFPYPSIVRWIARDGRTLKAEYHTSAGRVARRVTYTWKRVGERWVWDTVTATDPDSGARTVLTLTDQRVDRHLSPRVFSEATLRAGPERFF